MHGLPGGPSASVPATTSERSCRSSAVGTLDLLASSDPPTAPDHATASRLWQPFSSSRLLSFEPVLVSPASLDPSPSRTIRRTVCVAKCPSHATPAKSRHGRLPCFPLPPTSAVVAHSGRPQAIRTGYELLFPGSRKHFTSKMLCAPVIY